MPDFEIIVVDNGSFDGSLSLLEDLYLGKINLVKNADNTGFAKGNNWGILIAKGKFIATLNTDAFADSRWLEEITNVALSDDSIGMCASKILLLNEKNSIDSVGINIFPDGMSRQRGHCEDTKKYSVIEEILAPSACAALYRKSMLDECGLFDEDFFMYCEDTDLGLRCRLMGWKAVLAPQAVVYHHYSGSAGKISALKGFFVERNHVWVALKTFPLSMLVFVPFYSMFRFAAQALNLLTYREKISGNTKSSFTKSAIALAVFKAYFSAVRGIPAMLQKRRKIWASRKVSIREIKNWFRLYKLKINHLYLDP